MNPLQIKAGVTPQNLVLAAAAANVATEMGVTVTITSGTDGRHMQGSKHYSGNALDFRLLGTRTTEFIDRMRAHLRAGYDVVLEADHVHIEFDPK